MTDRRTNTRAQHIPR